MEYPKIHSLFKRDLKTHALITGDYSCPEFKNIKHWLVEEKIDGTNVRIVFNSQAPQPIQVLGRTKDSALPKFLTEYMHSYFTQERLSAALEPNHDYILFGEGYGQTIQAAGPKYRPDAAFMLFDVLVNSTWLTRTEVHKVAKALNLPTPPVVGVLTETQIMDLLNARPQSTCSAQTQTIEGIIARAEPLTFFENGNPIIWKLKIRDLHQAPKQRTETCTY